AIAPEELEEAAALYGGEPLPEDRYEDWAQPIRERVQRSWRDLCMRLASGYEEEGELDRALSWVDRLLAEDPLDEDAVQRVLGLTLALGRRAEGVRRYGEFERRLREELDAEPVPETVALAEELTALEPAR